MSDETTTTALTLISPESFKEIMTGAPEILQRNQLSVQKANEAGQAILDTIEGNGMSDELDAAANAYQLKVKVTYEQMQERRKPITKIFDDVKKAFTSLEASIDPKNPESVFFKVQTYRDKYAQKKKDEERRAEEARQRELNKAKEKNDIRARAEVLITNNFNAFLTTKLNEISSLLNDATLETIDKNAEQIINFPEAYPVSHFDGISVPSIAIGIQYTLNTVEEVSDIISEVKASKKDQFIQQYTLDIQSHKERVSLNVAARRDELQQIEDARIAAEKAAADARIAAEKSSKEEAERLQKLADDAAEQARIANEEASKRKADEDARLLREQKDRDDRAAAEAAANQQTADMTDLFAASAESQPQAAGVKESYQIEVTNSAAYLLIASFWMEREGMKLIPDEIEKKTFKQMKTFCEKHAMKTEEKIKSPYIIYKEVAKASVIK